MLGRQVLLAHMGPIRWWSSVPLAFSPSSSRVGSRGWLSVDLDQLPFISSLLAVLEGKESDVLIGQKDLRPGKEPCNKFSLLSMEWPTLPLPCLERPGPLPEV